MRDPIPVTRPRAKPKGRHHHGDLRRALLTHTLALVEKKGVHAVTLRALARRLGVSEAAPYHHFKSKQELLACLAAEGYARLHDAMRTAVDAAGADPFARLAGLGRAYVEVALAHPGMFRLMFGEHLLELGSFSEVQLEGSRVATLHADVARACVGVGGRSGLSEATLIRTSWALVHGIAWLVLEQEVRFEPGEPGAEELTEQAVAILVAGIQALMNQGASK